MASGEIGDAGLAAAVWDLESLVDGGPDGARALLDDAARRAGVFAGRYGGRVLQLDGVELTAAVQEWSGIRETMLRAFMYASLSHQRDLSEAAAGALYASVAERRSEIEQTLDRLRGRQHWLDARNRENEISGEAVQALVDAVVGRYDVSHRWHRLKARLLGLDRLADFDVLAPIGALDARYSYAEARELVLDSYGSLSSRAREIVARFFDEGWIDAPPRVTKFPGAFCDWSCEVHHTFC